MAQWISGQSGHLAPPVAWHVSAENGNMTPEEGARLPVDAKAAALPTLPCVALLRDGREWGLGMTAKDLAGLVRPLAE